MPATDTARPARRPRPRFSSVRVRIRLLLAAAGLALVAISLGIADHWHREVALLLADRVHAKHETLVRILDLRAGGARAHAHDYTLWDDMVRFVHHPDPAWGKVNITDGIGTFDVDAAWVLDERGAPVFSANPGDDSTLAGPPLPLPTLAAALHTRPIRHFFVATGGRLTEVWTSSIQPTADTARATPANGYYVIGRRWTPARLQELAKDAMGDVRLAIGPGMRSAESMSAETGLLNSTEPLPGLDGPPVAAVRLTTVYPLAASMRQAVALSLVVVVGGVLLTLLLLGLALAAWVGKPLDSITAALHLEDPKLLRSTLERPDELGDLSRAAQEFFDQQTKLIEAREAADAAARARTQFLANISHELRTPMHGILSYARFGARGAQTAEREQLQGDFRSIEECGTGLLALLNDLLDLAKFEAGRMTLSREPVSLAEVAAASVDEFASLFQERGLRVQIMPGADPPPVSADHGKLMQVLRNLLSNAAKFSPQGSTVTIQVADAGATAFLVVEDEGTGIPAAEVELIFDLFAQASNATNHAGGTGLGLALCREIVAAHGGRIWAENRLQGGARFVVELPHQAPAAAPAPVPLTRRAA